MKQKIALYIQPGSKQTCLAGSFDGKPKIKIKSPAQDNQANTELVKFLAKILGIAKSSVEIVQGQTGRNKVVEIDSGLSAEEILGILTIGG